MKKDQITSLVTAGGVVAFVLSGLFGVGCDDNAAKDSSAPDGTSAGDDQASDTGSDPDEDPDGDTGFEEGRPSESADLEITGVGGAGSSDSVLWDASVVGEVETMEVEIVALSLDGYRELHPMSVRAAPELEYEVYLDVVGDIGAVEPGASTYLGFDLVDQLSVKMTAYDSDGQSVCAVFGPDRVDVFGDDGCDDWGE